MKVFITGVSGLLGSTLAKYLLQIPGICVVGVDNGIGGVDDNIPLGIEFYHADVTDVALMKELMSGSEVVFHAAALPYEGLSVFSPTITTNSIVVGTVAVATAAIHNKVRLLVNCSSMARYGDQIPPFTEDMPTKPVDPYGLAKVHAEQYLELFSKLHRLHYVTVVPHNVIGVGQRYFDPFRNVVGIMINRTLQGKGIIVYGDGEQKRSFSDVSDCIEAVAKIIFTKNPVASGSVYNIGPDNNEISILQLAQLVKSKTGINAPLIHFPDRPVEVKNAYCSSAKIKQDFNYTITKSIEETLEDMITWIAPRVRDFEYHLPIEIVTEKTPKTWSKQLI